MKTGIKVAEAMTRNPVMAKPDETLQECAKKMSQNEVGSIVIEDKGKLVGIISEKDIVERVVSKSLDSSKVKAKDVMVKEIIMINPEKDIYDALNLMGHEEIRKLPVVSEGKLVGLLTLKDILKIEPALFEIFATQIEHLKEENKKPVKYLHGVCESCGSEGPIKRTGKKYLCMSCSEE